MTTEDTRRVKIAYIDQQAFVDYLNSYRGRDESMLLACIVGQEVGEARVVTADFDIARRAIRVLLWRKDWPIVDVAVMPPEIDGGLTQTELTVRKLMPA